METVNIIIEMEDGGVMKGELYPEIAPIPSCYPRIYDSRWRI